MNGGYYQDTRFPQYRNYFRADNRNTQKFQEPMYQDLQTQNAEPLKNYKNDNNPNSFQQNQTKNAFVLNVSPLYIVWMYYTKQFHDIRRTYNIEIIYERDVVLFSGDQKAVEIALKDVEDFVYSHKIKDIQVENWRQQQRINRNFTQFFRTQQYRNILQESRGYLCIILKRKFKVLSQILRVRYGYDPCYEEVQQLESNFILLFQKKNSLDYYQNQIMDSVLKIQERKLDDVPILTYSQYQSKSAQQNEYLKINKLDIIWLLQNDKLEQLSKIHYQGRVNYKVLPKDKDPINVELEISSPFAKDCLQFIKQIKDTYLDKLLFERIEFQFEQHIELQEKVTPQLKDYIVGYQKKQNKGNSAEFEHYRFIESDVMREHANQIDKMYGTQLVDFLDEKEGENKYLYVLGVRNILPDVKIAVEVYFKRISQKQHRGKEKNNSENYSSSSSYLQNSFDESFIQ